MGLASFNKARRMQELLNKEVSVEPTTPPAEVLAVAPTEVKPRKGLTINRSIPSTEISPEQTNLN